MSHPLSYPGHVRALLVLGLPLIGGNLAQFAIHLTDTVMLGWYGVEELAAVTLAASYHFVLFMLGSGFAMAVMPLVAAASARHDETGQRRATRMGMWLSVAFSAAVMPALWWSGPVLRALGQGETLSADAALYLRIAGWGLFPGLLVMVMRSFLAAVERAQVVLWITVLAAAVNAALNYALIFGRFGLPEMGLAGAATASVVTLSVELAVVVAYVERTMPQAHLFRRLWRPDRDVMAHVFRLGVPIGLTSLSEVSLFTVSAVLMGWLGTVPLAAHGIALQLASATFMVHLGLSAATTVRMGHAYGTGDRTAMTRGGQVAMALSLAVSAPAITAFLSIPGPLVSAFLEPDDPERSAIIAIGTRLLAVAALFQTVDGLQVMALGMLRGVQDTTRPMLIAAISYMAIGVPTSYVLGFALGLGGVGVWLGLVVGLACAGGLLMARFWRVSIRRAVPAAGAV